MDQTGVMRHFEGFGVCHPDPYNPESKRSVHSYMLTRDAGDGHMRLRYRQFMNSSGPWKPEKEAEGPLTGDQTAQ